MARFFNSKAKKPFFFKGIIVGRMKTTFGLILLIIGLIGSVTTSISAIQESETISIFGEEVLVSSGNYIPVFFSIIILFVGILSLTIARGK